MRIRKKKISDENVASLLSTLDRQAVEPDRECLKQLRERSVREFTAGAPDGFAKTLKSTPVTAWRVVMKSPAIKFVAAAIIAVACVIGLLLWRGMGSGVTLADVLTRIEQVTAYMYQVRSTVMKQQTSTESIMTVLISEEHGVKMLRSTVDPESGAIEPDLETYLSHRPNSIMFVSHTEKTHFRLKYEDDSAKVYREEYNDPRIIVQQILACDHISLGQSVVDGVTVEGFQTTDLAYKGGFLSQADIGGEPENVDVKIWVDVNTFLPVRSEEDIEMKDGRDIHEVSYDFRWDVIVNADDFRPVVPEDYRTHEIVFPTYNEENTIKGLMLFGDLAGAYPANLDKKYLDGEVPRVLNLDSYETLSEDEQNRKMSQLAVIGGAGFFYYGKLVDEDKDPAYCGETVKLGEADKVLLRWKLDDGRYRVIFGDLTARTVTAEELAELEKP